MNKKMNAMLKEAKKMQQKMMEYQEELNNKVFTGSAGGGVVKIEMTGNKTLKSIHLEPEVVDPDDIEMLQDLLITAFNDASKQVDSTGESQLSDMTSGLNIPGLKF